VIDEELRSMTRKMTPPTPAPSTANRSPSPYPNLMFRKEFKWKGKSHD
jgi:hypothetical protein